MAGYVIHLAVAEIFYRKHSKKIKRKEEFIRGTLAPDGTKNKNTTHFGVYASDVDLAKFLEKHTIEEDYYLGYFIHLLVDYFFYNRYFNILEIRKVGNELYEDYDVLNKRLLEKYAVMIPKEVEKSVLFKEKGELYYLSYNRIIEMIEYISNLDVYELAQNITEVKIEEFEEEEFYHIEDLHLPIKTEFIDTPWNKKVYIMKNRQGTIVGSAIAVIYENREAEILYLQIEEAYRNKKNGSRLLTKLIIWIRNHNPKEIKIRKYNQEEEAFYLKHQFQKQNDILQIKPIIKFEENVRK